MTNLIAQDLSFSFGNQLILEGISLTLQKGSLTALVGPNGAGKSTLLRLLQGQNLPDQGSIFLDDLPIRQCRSQVALMPQRSSINWSFPITVEGLVALGRLDGSSPACCEIEASLQRVGLSELGQRRLDSLSGGQQQRALLARTLAQSASVFLLDEPCAALDPPSREQFLTLVRQLADSGLAFCISSHDWGESLNAYDRVIVLDGKVMALGTPEEVICKLQSISTMGNHCFD